MIVAKIKGKPAQTFPDYWTAFCAFQNLPKSARMFDAQGMDITWEMEYLCSMQSLENLSQTELENSLRMFYV